MEQNSLNLIFCFFISIPAAVLIYNILPSVYILLCKQDNYHIRDGALDDFFKKTFNKIPKSNKLRNFITKKLYQSGVSEKKNLEIWAILVLIVPVLIFIFGVISNRGILFSLCTSTLSVLVPVMWINGKIKNRKNAFAKNAYKIYFFLHSQISSGIKPTDAIRGLYEISDNIFVRETFIKFVARYELTLNIDESLQIIQRSFTGYDAEMLCVSIKQCVQTGQAGKTLLKMEKMMFSKYFYFLQKETEKYKTRLLICGLLGTLPIMIMLSLPLIYEVLEGFKEMFQG